jgi:SsrA-binding protein
MAKTKKAAEGNDVIVNICRNRRAKHDYELSDAVECGIVLVGTEVKSLRQGHAQLDEAYAKIEDGELWLIGCEIPEYSFGNRLNHTPKRQRKLLLHRREIRKLETHGEQRGHTIIPLQLYFKNGRAKVEVAVGRGKQSYDKRQTLKKSEAKREIDRAMAKRRRK